MTWIKLNTGAPMSPRICAAGDRAAWLWVQALCWSAENLTDGYVPAGMLLRISGEADASDLAERLVEVGLFEPDGDGWLIHKFADYQRTREDVEAQRATWREQKARSRRPRSSDGAARRYVLAAEMMALNTTPSPQDVRGGHDAESAVDTTRSPQDVRGGVRAGHDAESALDITRSPREFREEKGRGVRPLEKKREDTDTRDRPAVDAPSPAATPAGRPFEADFVSWWSAWPKKVDRRAAYQRYAARRRDGVTADELAAARDRYLDDLRDPQYCKHGATFLNASDGPWSEFRDGVAPDTREATEELLPPFLALSRVEDKLRARGIDVDVERLDALIQTLGFTGAWYDLPATVDILAAALAEGTDGSSDPDEMSAVDSTADSTAESARTSARTRRDGVSDGSHRRVASRDATVAATTVLTVAEDPPTTGTTPPMVDNDTLNSDNGSEEFAW